MGTRKVLLGMAAMIVVAIVAVGCNGVVLNPEFDRLLDQTADLSAETARRAHDGKLTSGDMRDALIYQASVWQQFRNARDGVKSDPLPAEPTTQPTSLLELAPGPHVACKTIE